MQEVYLATILHPGDKVEWLYTFANKQDAEQCAYDYCRKKEYYVDTGHTVQVYAQTIRDAYDPERHGFGLMVTKGIAGDWRDR